tara:strand:+ start:547 stop:1953 length:1407 start_codon:yes stop_codon:yes gene_type:complete
MINRTFKRIHNKYSNLFKFIFFLRYLFVIFFISSILFLTIPFFFDLEKKDKVIKKFLLEKYGLSVSSYENIKYNVLPTPNLEIKNIDVSLRRESMRMNVEKLNIYIKLINIYDSSNFDANKIVIKNSKIQSSDTNLKNLIYYIYNLKNRFTLKNLNLKITRKDETLMSIEKINFSNFGYKKNLFTGELFDKNFKILINDNFKKIDFKLLRTGVSAEINFYETKKKNQISGIFKSKFLSSNLKFNFDYGAKKVKIYDSYFRSKHLSFNNESTVIHSPFFSSNSIFKIEDINLKLLKNLNLNKIINSKNLIKKINLNNKIIFKSNTFNNNLIDDLYLSINLAYGRLNYSKKIIISENIIICDGNINLLEEYPVLYFNCSITSKDKKKLLKKFKIKYKNKNELFKLNTKGNINILGNKINFQNILVNNKDYSASNEDLNYFKQIFESILFDKDFIGIFNLKKIKDFVLEVS